MPPLESGGEGGEETHEDDDIMGMSPSVEEIVSAGDGEEGNEPQAMPIMEREYLPQLIQGMLQGTILSPAEYVSMEDYLATLAEAQRAYETSGNIQYMMDYFGEFYEEASFDGSPGYEDYYAQDQVESSSRDGEDYSMPSADNEQVSSGFEGDTVASTASYLTAIEVVRMANREPQTEGFVVEIPMRELDDPPDAREYGLPQYDRD